MLSYLCFGVGISGLPGEDCREELEERQPLEPELGECFLVLVDEEISREEVSIQELLQPQGFKTNANQPDKSVRKLINQYLCRNSISIISPIS